MSKSAVNPVFYAETPSVRFVDTGGGFVVPQMVASLSISGCPVQEGAFISISTESCQKINFIKIFFKIEICGKFTCGLIVLGAVLVCTVVEGAIPLPDGLPPPLILKVPVEAGEGPVLRALVLQEKWALLNTKFVNVSIVIGQLWLH